MIQFIKKVPKEEVVEVANPSVQVEATAPAKAEGIWLQNTGEEDILVDKIIFSDKFAVEEYWEDADISTLPYNLRGGGAVTIGTDIFIFGGNSGNRTAYKYDTLTHTYTALASIPYNFYGGGGTAAVGTDIYLFGGDGSDTAAYKYDTITNTYEALPSIPDQFYGGTAAAVGTAVYLFGKGHLPGNARNVNYKFDTVTKAYTATRRPPFVPYDSCRAVAYETDVYLFGGYASTKAAYKYNTLTDTYTKLTDIPYDFTGGAAAVTEGAGIYLFGGTGGGTTVYKYDILNNLYKKVQDIPYGFANGSAVTVEKTIYLLGGMYSGVTLTHVRRLQADIVEYPDNSVLVQIDDNAKYSTVLVPNTADGRPVTKFTDAWHYTKAKGLNRNLPAYYGNGTDWIKFKKGTGTFYSDIAPITGKVTFNIPVTSQTKIEYKLKLEDTRAWNDVFHANNSFIQRNGNAGAYSFYYNNNPVNRDLIITWDTPHTITLDNNKYYLDGVLQATASTDAKTTDTSFYINGNSAVAVEFYYLKIYEAGELTHEIVPQEIISESGTTYALYDKVTGTTYGI